MSVAVLLMNYLITNYSTYINIIIIKLHVQDYLPLPQLKLN